MFFLIFSSTFSQDLIILKNGDEIKSKVEEINQENIKYKKFENLTGPLYTLDIYEIFMIKYENGTKDVFNYDDPKNNLKPKENGKTPSSAGIHDYLTDPRDGNTYKTVNIGEQVWMAENLKYDAGEGCWVYDNNPTNASIYGRLYNWETAMEVCPTGWHLSSYDEWVDLVNYIGGDVGRGEYIETWLNPGSGYKRAKEVGGVLKETDTKHWVSPNSDATDELGFRALPGGKRKANGKFGLLGREAHWWTDFAMKNHPSSRMVNSDGWILDGLEKKDAGLSVRCVKDKADLTLKYP